MDSEQVIDQIRQIKDQYEAQVTGNHKQWPRAIKDRVAALANAGMKIQAISDRTGISRHTVASWTAKLERRNFKELTVSEKGKELNQVRRQNNRIRTVARKPAVKPVRRIGTVTMTTPSGYKIEGICPDELLVLLKKLGRP